MAMFKVGGGWFKIGIFTCFDSIHRSTKFELDQRKCFSSGVPVGAKWPILQKKHWKTYNNDCKLLRIRFLNAFLIK